MDAFSNPDIEQIVCCFATQTGKTEMEYNCLGFVIDQDPSPALLVMPTEILGKYVSRNRIQPMIEASERLRNKKTQDPDDFTTLEMKFQQMVLSIAGANSAASLSVRPVRYLFRDEINKFPAIIGKEADPMSLSKERTKNFWNRKIFDVSTPTNEDGSITRELETCDAVFDYHVPCPHCGFEQILRFSQIKWPQEERDPEKVRTIAWYECESCNAVISDHHKTQMLKEGSWKSREAGISHPRKVGFHLPAWYSPWVTWGDCASEFLKSKDYPEKLRNFRNSWEAEPWLETMDAIESEGLIARKEDYGPKIPSQAGVLTAAVDVQDDRLEVEIIAWGPGEESWSMDFKIFMGSPALEQPWSELDTLLQASFEHELGAILHIAAVCVDTGGHFTKNVYEFVRPRQTRRVFAIKGSNQANMPIVTRPKVSAVSNVRLFSVGTDTAKQIIYARLKLQAPGPGFLHFPKFPMYDEEYFRQLAAEKCVIRMDKRGFPYREWIKEYKRNEALDLKVYNLAALTLLNVNWERVMASLQKQEEAEDELKEPAPDPRPLDLVNPITNRPRGGWMKGYKR
jgi:phage terminase large subunit GpA-like protein